MKRSEGRGAGGGEVWKSVLGCKGICGIGIGK